MPQPKSKAQEDDELGGIRLLIHLIRPILYMLHIHLVLNGYLSIFHNLVRGIGFST